MSNRSGKSNADRINAIYKLYNTKEGNPSDNEESLREALLKETQQQREKRRQALRANSDDIEDEDDRVRAQEELNVQFDDEDDLLNLVDAQTSPDDDDVVNDEVAEKLSSAEDGEVLETKKSKSSSSSPLTSSGERGKTEGSGRKSSSRSQSIKDTKSSSSSQSQTIKGTKLGNNTKSSSSSSSSSSQTGTATANTTLPTPLRRRSASRDISPPKGSVSEELLYKEVSPVNKTSRSRAASLTSEQTIYGEVPQQLRVSREIAEETNRKIQETVAAVKTRTKSAERLSSSTSTGSSPQRDRTSPRTTVATGSSSQREKSRSPTSGVSIRGDRAGETGTMFTKSKSSPTSGDEKKKRLTEDDVSILVGEMLSQYDRKIGLLEGYLSETMTRVDKLTEENFDLVEKVNDLHLRLMGQREAIAMLQRSESESKALIDELTSKVEELSRAPFRGPIVEEPKFSEVPLSGKPSSVSGGTKKSSPVREERPRTFVKQETAQQSKSSVAEKQSVSTQTSASSTGTGTISRRRVAQQIDLAAQAPAQPSTTTSKGTSKASGTSTTTSKGTSKASGTSTTTSTGTSKASGTSTTTSTGTGTISRRRVVQQIDLAAQAPTQPSTTTSKGTGTSAGRQSTSRVNSTLEEKTAGRASASKSTKDSNVQRKTADILAEGDSSGEELETSGRFNRNANRKSIGKSSDERTALKPPSRNVKGTKDPLEPFGRNESAPSKQVYEQRAGSAGRGLQRPPGPPRTNAQVINESKTFKDKPKSK